MRAVHVAVAVCIGSGALALCTTGGAAQQFTVDGRVVEAGTGTPVGGVRVELAGRPAAITGGDGAFRFAQVERGRYILAVRGLGWASEEITLIVQRDTTLRIELTSVPIELDTLAVEARDISVRGVVRDAATGTTLMGVAINPASGRETRTDPIGRFRLRSVPANTPFAFQVLSLGFLPQFWTIEAAADTTLDIALEVDPIAVRAMDAAKQRLAERAAPRRYDGVPVITRADLLRNPNRSAFEVMQDMLRGRRHRIACYVIDERYAPLGSVLLETMLPDHIEHIELIEFGFGGRDLMARIYTRDYFPSVMVRAPDVLSQTALLQAARSGRCR